MDNKKNLRALGFLEASDAGEIPFSRKRRKEGRKKGKRREYMYIICVYLYVYICASWHVYVCTCVNVLMCLCACVYVYAYMYMRVRVRTSLRRPPNLASAPLRSESYPPPFCPGTELAICRAGGRINEARFDLAGSRHTFGKFVSHAFSHNVHQISRLLS